MRVLFAVVGARPCLFPLVPMAWAFRAAGHEVRITSISSLGDDIVHTGLPAVLAGKGPRSLGVDVDGVAAAEYLQPPWPRDYVAHMHLLNDEQRALLRSLGQYMVWAAEASVDDLLAFAKWWRPDLIVHEAVCYAAMVTAGVLGVPNVRHMTGPDAYVREELLAPDVPNDPRPPLPEYVALFERFGVPPSTTATMVVDPNPPSMRLPVDGPALGVRYVPYNGPGVVPDWVLEPADRPRVCLTWGHTEPQILGAAAADPFRQVIDALSDLGIELVVTTNAEQLEALGPVPPGTRKLATMPLNLILPGCDLLVHQGGSGTVLTAACAGVPQLAISRKPDAETSPDRLAVTGAGEHLHYQDLRADPAAVDVLSDTIAKLLAEPAYRTAAEKLRAEIEREPPPAELVPELARLARG
jgi:UDP:flavonoid glycosyltransferase YjiC (YdhE family)